MKTRVHKDRCIGCGLCESICPDVYKMDDDGLASAIEGDVPDKHKDDVKEATGSCPVEAIETEE